jgi:primosomal replication protein N
MESSWNENRAELQGTLAAKPSFSYESHGIRYFLFPLAVKRLSGAADVLNIVVSQQLLPQMPSGEEIPLLVLGEIRSFNNKSGTGSRLIITVLAREILPGTEGFANQLTLAGTLCKAPVLRQTRWAGRTAT